MKIMYKLIIVIFAVVFIMGNESVTAQISAVKQISTTIKQYQKAEWEIQLKEKFSNPYIESDIALNMLIVSPTGKQFILPCYFESGLSGSVSTWKARFAGSEIGTYSYVFQLNKNSKLINTTSKANFSIEASSQNGFLRKNNNWSFRFDNGKAFRGIGENICWEARSNDDSKYFKQLHENQRFNYEFMLRKLASSGGNYTRIWMCPWNLPLEWKTVSSNTNRYTNSTNYFNPSAISKLDRLFELSDSLGIYIMLALDQAGNFGDDWKNSNYNIKNGGFARNDSDFFCNPKAQIQYKNRLRYLIARWGYSSSIGAWEFFNEIDYLSFQKDTADHSKSKAVVAWHKTMSSWLKNNDPYQHLITTSISHRDVDGLNSINDIDFNQRHIYKYTKGIPSTVKDYSNRFNKPYVIGEFGFEWDWSKNFDEFANDMDNDFKCGLWYGLFSQTPVLPLSWWWEYFENRGLMSYFARVREISDLMLAQGNGVFKELKVDFSNEKLITHSLTCGQTHFIYLQNTSNDNSSTTLELSDLTVQHGYLYNCETGDKQNIESISQHQQHVILSNISIPAKSQYIVVLN